ncbi:hypothetical protein LINPERPRIM_LOCUS13992 [Linum perenne]
MPSFHLPNFLKSCSPFLYDFGVMFLTVLFKCLLVRPRLMPHIFGVKEIENGEYDVSLPLFPALNHLG